MGFRNDEDAAHCLALVINNSEISLWDVDGQVRSFVLNTGNIHDLCFSSHGHDTDDLLTPCLDEDGRHGTPEELCFCGMDTPHLHAHVYDPETCQCIDTKALPSRRAFMVEAALMKLARITLVPSLNNSGAPIPSFRIPSTKDFPQDCNSKHLPKTAKYNRDAEVMIRRLALVSHEDHVDHLIHNRETGHVYVEHSCSSCEATDCHGVFGVDEKRLWDNKGMGGSRITLHFYRAATLRGDTVTSHDWTDPVITRDPMNPMTSSLASSTCLSPNSETSQPKPKPESCCDSCVGDSCVVNSTCSAKTIKSSSSSSTNAGRGCRSTDEDLSRTEACQTMSLATNPTQSCCDREAYFAQASSKTKSCCSKTEISCDCTACTTKSLNVTSKLCCDSSIRSTEPSSKSNTCKTKCHNNSKTSKSCYDRSVFSTEPSLETKSSCSQEDASRDYPPSAGLTSHAVPKLSSCRPGINSCSKKSAGHGGETSCCSKSTGGGCNPGAFQLEDESVSLASNESCKRKSKRSRFFVKEICCATEVAAIRKIIGPLKGVQSLRFNVTSKMLYVNHDPDHIGAADICAALTREMFGVRIEQDGALESTTISSFVTSVLGLDDSEMSSDKVTLVDFLATYDSNVVRNVVVDVPGKRVTLMHNALLMPAEGIVKSLSESLGVEARVLKDGKDSLIWEFPSVVEATQRDNVEEDSSQSTLRPTVLVSGILLLISMLSLVGGNWEYLKYVALLSVAFGLPPIAMKALVSLRGCRFDVNCLMSFAAIGAVALQDFTEAAAVTFLFALSEWLESRATRRARKALSAILHLRPESANLIHPQTGELVIVPVGAVPVGATVWVRAGDKIPCDGVVMEGFSTVDESSLTGESRPVRKGPDDPVSGGTINSGNAQITVRTTASADDSAVARLIRLVEEAQANRSQTEKLVDEFAAVYTPVVVFGALLMCTIPWIWGRDAGSHWSKLGLVLIVVACPCALVISTPVSYVAGLAAAAQRGILIKGGAHLEALGLVRTVCFDKTGTLTKGQFQLLQFEVLRQKKSRKEALQYLALMEERASHPLAQALVKGARNEGVSIPKERFVRNHVFLPGEGVSGTIDGLDVHVGNVRLFERLGLYQALSESERQMVEEWETIGTVGFMSVGHEGIVCAYCVADAIRPESAHVLKALRELGIDRMMLTGDKKETAVYIGLSIGFTEEEIRSELLPEGKLAIMSNLRQSRPRGQSILSMNCSSRRLCLMIGDGVNDAPALAAADIGVAVAGAALAMETADVTLLDSHLDKLVYCIKMGRRVIRKIKENIIFSLTVKFLVLGFALAGRAALWAAIASDVGAMLLVTLNSMMLLPANGAKTDVQMEGGVHQEIRKDY